MLLTAMSPTIMQLFWVTILAQRPRIMKADALLRFDEIVSPVALREGSDKEANALLYGFHFHSSGDMDATLVRMFVDYLHYSTPAPLVSLLFVNLARNAAIGFKI